MTSDLKDAPGAVVPMGPDKRYRDWLLASDWHIPHCTSCRTSIFPPRIVCPHCGGEAFEWKRPSGMGTVYSTTTMRRPEEAGGDVNLSLVDLDEGPRMMTRVVDAEPGAIRCGSRVHGFVDNTGPEPRVLFRLAGSIATERQP